MNENPYEDLLAPNSRKRNVKEILSFKPRTMKAKTEEASTSSSPRSFIKEESSNSCNTSSSPRAFIKEETVTVKEKDESIVVEEKEESIAVKENDYAIKEEKQSSTVDVLKALETISLHLLNNKKFTKAMKLMLQLVESSMNESNGEIFFRHLSDLMKGCPADRDISASAYSQGYRDLIAMYYGKIEFLRKESLYQLESYYILVCLRGSFETDDPFLYSRLCTELKSFIMLISSANISSSDSSNSSNSISGRDDSSEDPKDLISFKDEKYLIAVEREKSLLACLETAFKIYHWTWAKQPCDSLYSCSAERRLFFSDENRDSLDALTTIKIQAQRKDTSWSGPQTIRTYNSTSHPLLSKNVGLLR